MDAAALLARSELFCALEPDELAAVSATAREVELLRNETAFGEGQPADELFLVRSGRIAIAKRSCEGRESVVALMEAGDLFGELSLFDGAGRSAEARALEPSRLLALPYERIRTVLEGRPVLLWHVAAILVRRLRAADAALADNVFLDVTGRTAKRLLEIAGGSAEFSLPVTQEELAAMVGASRERVNKAIGTFVRLGWLEQCERRYRILDREQLSLRAT